MKTTILLLLISTLSIGQSYNWDSIAIETQKKLDRNESIVDSISRMEVMNAIKFKENLNIKHNNMTDLQIANMLADYHKECELAETLTEKADVQLKHARLIREALRQPFVSGNEVALPSVAQLREIKKDRPDTFLTGALYIIDLIERGNDR